MDDRPLILIDWDGVINVESASARTRRHLCYHHGWRQRWIDRPFIRAFWNPEVGPWLTRLARETGGELAWGSRWEEYAANDTGCDDCEYEHGPDDYDEEGLITGVPRERALAIKNMRNRKAS